LPQCTANVADGSLADKSSWAIIQLCPLLSESGQTRARLYCPLWSSRPEEFHLQALREPCVNLSIHTAPDVRPLAHAASSFVSSTSSSCCQLASVGRWSRLNNTAPSVQLHYRAFVPNTSCSAPVLRIGTLVLTVLAACDFFLCIGATGSHVPYQSPVELRAASMPDAAWAVSGIPQADPGGMATPRF
jgi:hypothetical protein